jgi:hypothetical protein
MTDRAATMLTIADTMGNTKLLGASFAGPSWDRWEAVLEGAYCVPMDEAETAAFREVAERDVPKQRVKEFVAIVGRGGGKDSIASAIAIHAAISFDPKGKLRPGEKAMVMCLACDREQAGIVFNYIRASFEMVPALAKMVVAINSESIELNNRVVIEVHTNSYRSVRGRSLLCCICDEIAFWRSDTSSNPDLEVHAALKPGLARVPNSMLVLISTAHRRAGLLWNRFRECYAKNNNDVLVIKGTTLQFNPTADRATIKAALESDPQQYSAEYNSEWRSDLQSYVSRDAVEACVIEGRYELPPVPGVRYQAFIDPAGGSGGDSMTLSIAHKTESRAILDLVREWRPPFSPEAVVAECAEALKFYRVGTVVGDRWGGEFVREPFIRRGIAYKLCDKTKSDIYREFLPLINSGRIELLDLPKLVSQLASLERRVSRGSGRDSIDHPSGPGFHDDVCNAVAGALQEAVGRILNPPAWGTYGSDGIKILSGPKQHKWDGPDGMGGYAVSR